MIYLDNAATSFPKAPGVAEAMHRFLDTAAANPGRAGHRMAVDAERLLDEVRGKLCRLVGAPEPDRMIFAMNGTDALNMAIKGVLPGEPPRSGVGAEPGGAPHVITTTLEHNSVSRPLEALAALGAVTLTRLPANDVGQIEPSAIRQAITDQTQLIVMTHASNVLGTIQDAAAVGAIAREHDLLFCLDAAQTIGVLPIDVQAMQIDLLAFPGHKSLLGPTGIGGLYVGPRCPEPAEAVAATLEAGHMDQAITEAGRSRRLRPWREGGTGGDSSTPTQPALYPYYLEGGTPNTVGVAGLGAGIDYVNDKGLDAILAHERALVDQIIQALAGDDRFTIMGPADASQRVGTIAVNVRGYEPSDVGAILDDSFEIAVRPGLHCAPYVHKQWGAHPAGAVRISPGAFNTADDVAALIDALQQIAG